MIALLLFAVPARPAAADSWTGPDKAAHFGFSLSFGAAASAVLPFVDAPAAADWRGLALGSGIALLPGVAKEDWDHGGHGDPSWKDLGWDILGATVGAGLVWAVQRAMAPGAAAQAR